MNLTTQQIKEVNTLIEQIEKAIKPKCEIGAREKAVLTNLLANNNLDKKPVYFKCKKEYSDTVVAHFIKEKGLVKNRFHANSQSFIYLLF